MLFAVRKGHGRWHDNNLPQDLVNRGMGHIMNSASADYIYPKKGKLQVYQNYGSGNLISNPSNVMLKILWAVPSENVLWTCAKCSDSNHPAHAQSIIKAFALHSYTSVVAIDSVCGLWRPWSDCASAQSDQGLRCPHMDRWHIFTWWVSYPTD